MKIIWDLQINQQNIEKHKREMVRLNAAEQHKHENLEEEKRRQQEREDDRQKEAERLRQIRILE